MALTKSQEYAQYIFEHIENVKKAFYNYGELLCNELGLDYLDIENQIEDHDDSKWETEEFDIYRAKFHPEPGEEPISDFEFNKAWLHHIHNNPHHPQYWIYYDEDTNDVTVYEMPDKYIVEMLLDWIAMGYKFNNTAYNYYESKGKNKLFADKTRIKVEYLLSKIKEFDNNNLQH